jgi:hypothetical protein
MTNLSVEQRDAIKVIFDNAGGMTLQLGDWAHWYDARRIKQAAVDYHAYMTEGSTSGWDGHDEDAATLDPTDDQIRNGGYRVYNYWIIYDLKDLPWEVPEFSRGWTSVRDFINHFADLQHEQLKYEIESQMGEGN